MESRGTPAYATCITNILQQFKRNTKVQCNHVMACYLITSLFLLQPCFCSTTVWRCICGRAGSLKTHSAPDLRKCAGTARGSAPWKLCCSTAKVRGHTKAFWTFYLKFCNILHKYFIIIFKYKKRREIKERGHKNLQITDFTLTVESCRNDFRSNVFVWVMLFLCKVSNILYLNVRSLFWLMFSFCFSIQHWPTEKNPRRPPLAYLILAGCEPLTFTNIFPYWEKDPNIASKVGDGLSFTAVCLMKCWCQGAVTAWTGDYFVLSIAARVQCCFLSFYSGVMFD